MRKKRMMPNPHERLRRASDQMYLLMVQERSGKRRCSTRIMKRGLAAALLSDLVICRRIYIDRYSRNVLPLTHASEPPPYDLTKLDEAVLSMIWNNAPFPVTDWLDSLGSYALREVPRRLEGLNFLTYGGPLGARRWRPVDCFKASIPLSCLEYTLRNPDVYRGDATDTVLLALLDALRLRKKLFHGKHYSTLQRDIKSFMCMLPGDLEPSLQTLVAITE